MKELSPTTDSNLVKSLMSLIDCQMDEFFDEGKIVQLEDCVIFTWLEVSDQSSYHYAVLVFTLIDVNRFVQ